MILWAPPGVSLSTEYGSKLWMPPSMPRRTNKSENFSFSALLSNVTLPESISCFHQAPFQITALWHLVLGDLPLPAFSSGVSRWKARAQCLCSIKRDQKACSASIILKEFNKQPLNIALKHTETQLYRGKEQESTKKSQRQSLRAHPHPNPPYPTDSQHYTLQITK